MARASGPSSIRGAALVCFPLIWGRIADRHSPVVALRFITAGSAIFFAPLLLTSALLPVLLALAGWAAGSGGPQISSGAKEAYLVTKREPDSAGWAAGLGAPASCRA